MSSSHSCEPYLLLDSVVTVRLAHLDHLNSLLVQSIEVVTRVGDHIALDPQQLQIFKDRILKLLLLLGRVCIIETNDKLSLVVLRKVLVEQRRLRVSNMEITTGLRGEPRHNALIGIQKSNLEVRILALRLLLVVKLRLELINSTSNTINRSNILKPTDKVREVVSLDGGDRLAVGAECTPDSDIGDGLGVANQERAQAEVVVKLLESGRGRLEVLSAETGEAEGDPLVLERGLRSAEDGGEGLDELLQDGLGAVDDVLALELDSDGRGLVGLIEEIDVLLDDRDGAGFEGDVTVDDIARNQCGIEIGLRRLELS